LNKKILTPIIALLCVINVTAQEKEYFFYNPKNNFGSDALFNPLSVLVNGSYDVLRNGSHSKNVFDQYYSEGFKNVFWNLGRPLKTISDYGWDRFIELEIGNLEFNSNKANFVPNFADHTIGNGMLYAKLKEWYDYHQYPAPWLWSFITTNAYQLMNEAIENGRHDGPNIDLVADVYIFNMLGFVLFEFDFINRFFSETLPMYDWSLQPMFSLNNTSLENTGQQYVVRKQLPYLDNWSGFVFWGLNGIAGLSYSSDKINNYSLGVGQVTNKINSNIRGSLRFLTPDIDGAIAFFYDRNNSLLLSVLMTGPKVPNIRVNIYPGLIKIGSLTPGLFIGLGEWDKFVFGINLYHQLPFGLGFGFSHK
jgi:hypothetical protein